MRLAVQNFSVDGKFEIVDVSSHIQRDFRPAHLDVRITVDAKVIGTYSVAEVTTAVEHALNSIGMDE